MRANICQTASQAPIAQNDVIVVNNSTKSSSYVQNTDMYYTNTDYSTYPQTQYLDVEGKITSAIQKVLAEKKTKCIFSRA